LDQAAAASLHTIPSSLFTKSRRTTLHPSQRNHK
jgi:hypothetical protein